MTCISLDYDAWQLYIVILSSFYEKQKKSVEDYVLSNIISEK